jgi:hypothetical protein
VNLSLPTRNPGLLHLMPSPTPAFVASLIKRLGEEGAIEYLGRWSNAILDGEKPPAVPRSKRVQQ